jgi:hypothetical protein
VIEGVYVFVGSTLRPDEGRSILDATYLPPAQMGDIYNVVAQRGARAVGLIDGLFGSVPAVWHKEILFALSKGVRVFGSSSMGALRAAELHAFGMEGVGTIFGWYRDGTTEDDDEVAVAHAMASDDFRPLSEAFVNIRHGVETAVKQGTLSASNADILLSATKEMFYADRSWSALYRAARDRGVAAEEIERLRAWVAAERPNLKRDDALALLRRMAEVCTGAIAPLSPEFDFEPTIYWQRVVSTMSRLTPHEDDAAGRARAEEIRCQVHLSTERETTLRGALFLHLADLEWRRLGLALDPSRIDSATESFRRRRGLLTAASTRAWTEQNDVGEAELAGMVRLEAVVEQLVDYYRERVTPLVLTELKRRDIYAPIAQRVRQKREYLSSRGLPIPTLDDIDVDLRGLLNWYQRRVRFIGTDLEAHAKRLWFESARELVSQLVGEYIFAGEEPP